MGKIDPAEASDRLAKHVHDLVVIALAGFPSKQRPAAQVELSNRLLGWLVDLDGGTPDPVARPPRDP